MSQVHGSLSGWYTNAYSSSFRTSRLRAPSLVPQARMAIPIQQTLVVDLARNTMGGQGDNAQNGEDKKLARRRETIFGPDVGEDDAPGWTKSGEGEEVSVDVVKGWVEKAKSEEGLHATTTLQALVNLKRPTLLLQQLESEDPARSSTDQSEDITAASPSRPTSMIRSAPLHLLKFNYDATTPQVRVQLEIYPTPQPPVEGKESITEEFNEPRIVYSGLHQGGFNQLFTLPSSAALDLSSAIAPISDEAAEHVTKLAEGAENNGTNVPPALPILSSQQEVVSPPTPPEEQSNRGRFGGLFRRNREEDVEAAAGAPIEMTATHGANASDEVQGEKDKKDEIEQGMRLLISIDGVGPDGQSLSRRNAQLTHILINGMWVPDAGASTTNTNQNQGKRVWVVKVVRREAVIGKHTFLLKEIYGLSASSTSTTTTNTGSYPPTSDDPYASTPNECIVCLTSPRDVVLLPCRHLVVCRDCAVGMVEFGAGGKVARREDGDAAGGGDGEAGTGGAATASGAGNGPQVAGGTTTTGRERRKKKVKGWYCPVCRQPYTSLLRLALPEAKAATRAPSMRAPSIRSFKSSRSLRAPSIAPTLPDGAERMLESLRPQHQRADGEDNLSDEDDDDDEHEHHHGTEVERPQFVLGPEVDAKDTEVEHREVATPESHEQQHDPAQGAETATVDEHQQGRSGIEKKAEGWKEVV